MNKSHRMIRMTLLSLLICTSLIAPAAAGAAPPAEPAAGCTGVVQIPMAECQALETLYNSTAGPQWTDKAGWLVTTTPCSWYGVTCQAGHVTTLDLQDNLLTGALPGQLSDLTYLQHLLLLRNKLSGAIPTSLGSLAQLQELSLSQNLLTGGIPTQLANLTQLQISEPVQQPADRNDPVAAWQPARLADPGPLHQPVDRADTGRTRRAEQSGRAAAGQQPTDRRHPDATGRPGAICGGWCLPTTQLTGSIPGQLGSMSHAHLPDPEPQPVERRDPAQSGQPAAAPLSRSGQQSPDGQHSRRACQPGRHAGSAPQQQRAQRQRAGRSVRH